VLTRTVPRSPTSSSACCRASVHTLEFERSRLATDSSAVVTTRAAAIVLSICRGFLCVRCVWPCGWSSLRSLALSSKSWRHTKCYVMPRFERGVLRNGLLERGALDRRMSPRHREACPATGVYRVVAEDEIVSLAERPPSRERILYRFSASNSTASRDGSKAARSPCRKTSGADRRPMRRRGP